MPAGMVSCVVVICEGREGMEAHRECLLLRMIEQYTPGGPYGDFYKYVTIHHVLRFVYCVVLCCIMRFGCVWCSGCAVLRFVVQCCTVKY